MVAALLARLGGNARQPLGRRAGDPEVAAGEHDAVRPVSRPCDGLDGDRRSRRCGCRGGRARRGRGHRTVSRGRHRLLARLHDEGHGHRSDRERDHPHHRGHLRAAGTRRCVRDRRFNGGLRRSLGHDARLAGCCTRGGGAARDDPLGLPSAPCPPRLRGPPGQDHRLMDSAARGLWSWRVPRRRRTCEADQGALLKARAAAPRAGPTSSPLRPSSLERHPPCQGEVQHTTERVHIGSGVDPAAADLLWRDVIERADPLPAAGCAAVESVPVWRARSRSGRRARSPLDQQVGGLDVACTKPVRWISSSAAPAWPATARPPRRQRAGLVAYAAAQITSGDEPHRDIRIPSFLRPHTPG